MRGVSRTGNEKERGQPVAQLLGLNSMEGKI